MGGETTNFAKTYFISLENKTWYLEQRLDDPSKDVAAIVEVIGLHFPIGTWN